jgi:2-polyprenyl-3-methyl-5-hydroxy-6-metoxy-1,4-benzoquinol methylase
MQAARDKDSGRSAPVGPRTPGESKDLVEKGYNRIALRYLEWSSTSTVRVKYVQKLLPRLPEQAEVLELGCGAGVPCTQILVQHAHVTTNDISAVQIALAKERVPGAHLIQGDMMSLSFDEGTFDAIVALYSIIHLPREEQRLLMKRLAGWLRPGGHLLVNLATVDDAGSVEQNWIGGEMYWSSYDTKTNQEMVREAGFQLLEAEIICEDEDGKPVPFVWVLAAKENNACGTLARCAA